MTVCRVCAGKTKGFSLLDAMLAVLLLALLLALAVPSYQRYLQRSQRVEAIREILSLADCLERQRAESGYYSDAGCPVSAANPAYEFRIETGNEIRSQVFKIIATPNTVHTSDPCGTLSLDQVGTRGSNNGSGKLAACWGGR